MERIKYFILFFLVLVLGTSQAQNKYAIHYKFKPQEAFSLDRPEEFLTEKAVERREKYQIPLDSMDLPVSEKYINTIQGLTNRMFYHISWLNASVVEATEDQMGEITALDFVDKVILAAPSSNSGSRLFSKDFNLKLNLKNKRISSNVYDFQNGLLGIPEMHEAGFKGEGITIAVFDAGFPDVDIIPGFEHIFANNRVIGGKDFVDVSRKEFFTKNQHGTNVLSLIAALEPGKLVSGAPNSNFIFCITEDIASEYRIEEYNWVKAATFSDSLGVDIINSSLGYWDFDDPKMDYTKEDLDGKTAVISIGADIAAKKGILVVTSAGNYGGAGASSITAPADVNGILSIGATNTSLERSGFSSQGPTSDGRIKPDLSTLGERVYLYTRPNVSVTTSQGTSFSAPQIAALAAGLWQAKPELNKDELIELLKSSATQAEEPDNLLGYGIPNFSRAYFGEVLSIENNESDIHWKLFPNPLEGNILQFEYGNEQQVIFSLINSSGILIQEQVIERQSLSNPFMIEIPAINPGVYLIQVRSGNQLKQTKLIKK